MKKRFLILAGVLLIAMGLCLSCSKKEQSAKKEPPKGHEKMVQEMNKRAEQARKMVVATVNGNKINMESLIREMNALGPRFLKPGEKPTAEISAEVRKSALDNLIFRELALEEAKTQGMEVPPGAAEKSLQELKKRLGSEEAYKVYLDRLGTTESGLKTMIGDEHLFRMIISKEIFNKVKQPDMSQIKKAYGKEKLMLPERFIADDIYFGSAGGPDIEKKAEKVLSEIKDRHGDISKLAPDVHVAKQKTIVKGEFPTLYAALEKVKPGGITGIVKGRDGLHILKLGRKEPARRMTFKEARDIVARHLKFQAIEKRKEEWESQLKKKARIEITPREEKGIEPAS